MTELDVTTLDRRVSALVGDRWPGASVESIVRMPAGVSSLAYRVSIAPGSDAPTGMVLKVAPVGLPATMNRDVLRQARMMAAVAEQTDVPVPAILVRDDSEQPPMFGMEMLRGQSYEPGTDIAGDEAPDPAVVRARYRTATQALMGLQSVTPAALGAGSEPAVGPSDELERWRRLLSTVDDDICPGHTELYERLEARIPRPLRPTLHHGDYRLANMMFTDASLNGVIDWEIWAVGDPRADLAWLLMHLDPPHLFHRDRPQADQYAATGLPTVLDVLGDAAEAGARIETLTTDLPWFLALAAYKVASTVGVLAKRNRRLEVPAERLVFAAESLPGVIARGHTYLDEEDWSR
ncbi:phosphotransferase family protein [Janibacter sp. YIM B02568]|uniref:phosphotransferase family protein n=1 Tax=Janibacter endophyticus TaxID=2806261 RepID=UPI0019526675|nr:phosphotransferase family protein [Janibacter endophyticus]MBM6545411.1 phosphotransferase family protein [Janibacter endophyticus]